MEDLNTWQNTVETEEMSRTKEVDLIFSYFVFNLFSFILFSELRLGLE